MPSLLTESIELTSVMIIVVKKNLGVHATIMPVIIVVLMGGAAEIVCYLMVYQRLKAWS